MKTIIITLSWWGGVWISGRWEDVHSMISREMTLGDERDIREM